jgi:hypothetical protein
MVMVRLQKRLGEAIVIGHHPTLSILLFITVFAVLTTSVGFNLLCVANEQWYRSAEVWDQVVLDGILHSQQIHHFSQMGAYTRPSTPSMAVGGPYPPYALFASGSTEGDFVPYPSQFGLQAVIFGVLYDWLHLPMTVIIAVNALLSVSVLSAIYLALIYEFGALPGAAGTLTFALSPWIVVFAKSLYWAIWTWLLPVLLALLCGRLMYRSVPNAIMVGIAFFILFLLKFLCGYDYITTIILCSAAPVIYYGLKSARPASVIVGGMAVVGLAACLAFASAVSLQALRIADNFSDGINIVWKDAHKRTMAMSSTTQDVAEVSCSYLADVAARQDCKDAISASLNSSTVGVVAVYMTFRDFLPWLNGPGYDLDRTTASALKKAVSQGKFGQLVSVIGRVDRHEVVGTLVTAIQGLCGLALLAATTILMLRDRRRALPFGGLIYTSFLGAVSWFVLAKGHSQIHTHLNYIIWYIGFVPFSVLYLVWRHQGDRLPHSRYSRRLTLSGFGSGPRASVRRDGCRASC